MKPCGLAQAEVSSAGSAASSPSWFKQVEQRQAADSRTGLKQEVASRNEPGFVHSVMPMWLSV